MSLVKNNPTRSYDRRTEVVQLQSFDSQFTDVHLITKGGFGVMYSGIHKLDGNRYAIKHMRSKCNTRMFQMQIAEVRMLSCTYHPNIVRYHNSWLDERNGRMNIFMQMEFIHHTLESYLEARYDNRMGKHALDIAVGLVDAVHFLHVHMQPALIHGDITPSNIMLQYAHDTCTAKLCDFGLASRLASTTAIFEHQFGTITYQAPEYHTVKTTSVDIYSLGIVLFQLFCTFSSAMERCDRIRDFKEMKIKTHTLLDETIHSNHTLRPTIAELKQYMTQHNTILQDASL